MWVLLVLVAIATLLLAVLLVSRDYNDSLARAEDLARNAAHTAAEHVRWLVDSELQKLRLADFALGPVAPWPDDAAQTIAAEVTLGAKQSLLLVDVSGRGRRISAAGEASEVEVGTTRYFSQLVAGAEWALGSFSEAADGSGAGFTVARRLTRNGEFVGAVASFVSGDALSDFWSRLDLGPNSSVGLFRSDGHLIARYPVPTGPLDLSQHVLFTTYLPANSSGFYYSPRSPSDGLARMVGYFSVPDMPLVTVAGVSTEALLRPFWSRLTALLAVGAPLILVLISLTVWLRNVLRRDEQTREKLAEAVDENRLLLSEVHHRIKNNLQVVASLVYLQPGDADGKRELARRIETVSGLHEQLYRSGRFGAVSLDIHIKETVDRLRDTYGSDVAIEYDLPSISVDPEMALPLTLIVGEIVSNALKHAFKDGRAGTISISLLPSGETLSLTIRDNGSGWAPGGHTNGFGMSLLKALTQQIGGTYEFRSEGGLVFSLVAPLRTTHREAGKGAS